jgi:predicted O-linked N-acetylglucosamine transferase (SPINDLY family)
MNHAAATMTLDQALSLAIQRHQAGDVATAAEVYRELLRHHPDNAQITYLLAVCEHQSGRYEEAEALFRAAIGRDAAQPQFHLGLGRNYKQQGKYAEAVGCYRDALCLVPDSVEALVSLGVALWRNEQPAEAVEIFSTALRLAPDSFEAAVNCGNALLRLERLDDAIAMYRRALALRPDSADVHNNLGKVLVAVGRVDEARSSFDRALEILPSHPEALFNIGDLLFFSGNNTDAEKYYANAILARPSFAEGYMALGRARFDAGQFEQALECFDLMAAAAPASPLAQVWRGIVLREKGELNLALQAFEKAAASAGNPEEVFAQIGATYWQLGDYRNADEYADRVLESKPGTASALNLKGNVALIAGRIENAILWYDKAATVDPEFHVWSENALFARNYTEHVDAASLLEVHRTWGLRQRSLPSVAQKSRAAIPGARLRLGFVSPDFVSHSVAHFILPVLAYLDGNTFEAFCYHNKRQSDNVTQTLRKFANGWRNIAGKTDQIAAEIIARDGVDILIDLAGHTADNCLGLFARSPAPMQITYLGYPTTTGLPAMHYRLTDWIVDPKGAEAFNTETPLRLPDSYFCYMAPEESPAVSTLPALTRGAITFGSFNNLAKMTPTTLLLWGRVLAAVPGSRLLLKNKSLGNARIRDEVLGRLAKVAVDVNRVELHGYESARISHLALYNQVDIALDTFPYNGATTTCEALWMGAPVVTLRGGTHASRMGASILSAARLREWIAEDESAYVDACVRLAADLKVLAGVRAGLRTLLMNSPLMDYAGFARKFERTLRDAWEAHDRA